MKNVLSSKITKNLKRRVMGPKTKISGIEVVTPEATNILVWFGSLYVFISP
jgi:hypothetical protein